MPAASDIRIWTPELYDYTPDADGYTLLNNFPVDLSSATNLVSFTDYGDGTNMVMISNFTVRTDSDSYGPRAIAAQNVTFPTDLEVALGQPTVEFKITIRLDSPTTCTITKLWCRTNSYGWVSIFIPETSWPDDLPEITVRSGTESFGIPIMGKFIYEGTFYNIDFDYTNISDTWVISGYTLTVKRCSNFHAILPKHIGTDITFPPFTYNFYYQWTASPQVEFQHFFINAANTDMWVVPLTQQGTYIFFVKEFPSLGRLLPALMLPVDPILVKNLATNQIFNMTFFDRITTTDGEISLYQSNDNSLVIGLGLMVVFTTLIPAVYAWGESKWDNQRIDIMTKAYIVNMICQDVPIDTTYIYLDDDNIAQTGSIQTGNEVFKTCWFKHTLSDEFDQYVTSEGLVSDNNRFSDASGQEFNYKEGNPDANIYISTNTPQDIYWSYEAATK